MEEADLLKERLLAITDKRRVQEDIAKKRREIEEEKLKLQYLKKKSLREQWLMEGLSPQSQEDWEATRVQAQEDQQQAARLQTNINRMDEEIESLETQELSISANEEVILKKLKEVERTADDIIKELNAEFKPEPIQSMYSAIPAKSYQHLKLKRTDPAREDEPKQAMFAMEISVEKDLRTGESQVVSTATVTPQEFQERGVKVFDDGRKSVYALRSGGRAASNGLGELSPLEVEELLRQATDAAVPSEVQYHPPVYSRPCTPRTPSKTHSPFQTDPAPREGRQTPGKTPVASPSPFQPENTPVDEAQIWGEGCWTPSKTPSPSQLDTTPWDEAQSWGEETPTPPHQLRPGQSSGLSNGGGWRTDATQPGPAAFTSAQWGGGSTHGPLPLTGRPVQDYCRQSPLYPAGEAALNAANTLPPDLRAEPVTMIFMGYQNAEDEEEEEEDIQAELVVIGDDGGEDEDPDSNGDCFLSYHPEGYRSQVFQPRDDHTDCGGLHSHRPTFTHKPGQRTDRQTNQDGTEDSTNTALTKRMAKLGENV